VSTIRVAGHAYSVERVQPDADLDVENTGRCDHKRLRIAIDASPHDELQRKTLLHELIHCADKWFGSDNLKESQVLALENGLWAIFKDNPGLAEALFNKPT
jgi:hypothetical protein